MKTFKQYRKEKIASAGIGLHSLAPGELEAETDAMYVDGVPVFEAGIGKHSLTPSERTAMGDINEGAPGSEEESNRIHSEEKIDHASMTPEEHTALKDYTDDSFHINRGLIDHKMGKKIGNMSRDKIDTVLPHVDSLMSKHKTKSDMVVYTGVKQSPATMFKNNKEKVTANFPAFISTSTRYHVAKSFASPMYSKHDLKHGLNLPEEEYRHVLKLHVPAGSHAVSVRDHSWMPDEHEVLIHRGHNIEIHPEPKYHEPTKTFVWNGTVKDRNPSEIK